MAVSEIIDAARDALADPDKERWTDDRLIRLLNYGVKDLVFRARLLTSVVYLELETGTTTYDLSSEFLKLERVQFKEQKLPFMSHAQMDAYAANWQDVVGEDVVEAIIYDKMDAGLLRIYPSLTSISNSGVTQNSLYGILVDVSITNIPNFINFEDIVTDTSYLSVYGITKPEKVTGLNDLRPIPEQWDETLVHYIVGHALRTDMDDQNRAFGNEELQLYEISVAEISAYRAANSTVSTNVTSEYRTL